MKRPSRSTTVRLAGVVTFLALSGTTYALQQAVPAGADEVPPIYTQVAEHEERIGSLEGRADTTEAQVQENSDDITVIQQTTGAAPATRSTSGSSSSSTSTTPGTTAPQEPAPAPTPQPAPIDPRTITGVSEFVTGGLRTCDYLLHDWHEDTYQGVVIQPAERPCHAVGGVLPR